MANYKRMFLSIAIFAMGLGSTFSGFAFAYDQSSMYSHSHETASWNNGLVCGDHTCVPGQLSQNPPPVAPIRGH